MIKNFLNEARHFWPLLILYILIVLIFGRGDVTGDEERYLDLAQNLSQGFFSPFAEVYLWSGPGYPLFLLPLYKLGLPLIFLRLINAFLHIGSILLFYRTSLRFFSGKFAFWAAFAVGLYWPPFRLMPFLYTETFTIFLVSALTWSIVRLYKREIFNFKQLILPALILAALMLTKVVVAYVVLVTIILTGVFYLFKNKKIKWLAGVQLLALVFCIPYLLYTYNLTGKAFYWSNAGGMSLYWMSSPYAGEYGSWQSNAMDASKERCCSDLTEKLHANHGVFLESISDLDPIEKDKAFRTKAFENIKEHPTKYIQNWCWNISRMMFGFPFSYMKESPRTLFYVVPNGIALTLFILFLPILALSRRKIPLELGALAVFMLIYLFASSLISAYPRMLYIMAPISFLLLVFALDVWRKKLKVGNQAIE